MRHPTINRYNLKIYKSQYKGHCGICRGDYDAGDMIVGIAPILARLNFLGMAQKVYRYAHINCVPIEWNGEGAKRVRDAAQFLLDRTDPLWPRDSIGFSSGDASPAQKWFASDCDPLGTVEIARRLKKYSRTQLGGFDGLDEILKIGEMGVDVDVADVAKVKEEEDEDEEVATTKPSNEILGVAVSSCKGKGKVWVTEASGQLVIHLDPPWINPDHAEIKDRIKKVGARWRPEEKVWTLFPTQWGGDLDALIGDGIEWSQGAIDLGVEIFERFRLSSAVDVQDNDLDAKIQEVIPEGEELMPFQRAGVAFLNKVGGRALVGDEMGLGKTIQAVVYAMTAKGNRPVVVVVPAIVATNWEREIEKWGGQNVCRIKNGKTGIRDGVEWIVITYTMLGRRLAEIKGLEPSIVILDECHYAKNPKAQRTKAVMEICAGDRKVIGLSGTPILSRPVEFFTMLKILRPEEYKNWFWYTKRYCNGHRTRWGYKYDGASNIKELAGRIRDVMVRRTKDQVLTELPAKVRMVEGVKVSRDAKKSYHMAMEGAEMALEAITAARYECGKAKIDSAVEWAMEYVSQDLPLVIFAHHREVIGGIVGKLRDKGVRVGMIDGSISHDQRGQTIDDFQDGRLDIIVLSIKAGGVGITLTRASHVLMVERAWVPADEMQAEDRCHRIGQRDTVTVRYLMANLDIDQEMEDLLSSKRAVVDAVLDGGEYQEGMGDDIRSELISRMGLTSAGSGMNRKSVKV